MKWIILLLAGSLGAQTYDDYGSHLIIEEGLRETVYSDSRGYPTIGIGHRVKSYERFARPLSREQIDTLFIEDLSVAISGAKQYIPSFELQPYSVKIILVSMVFNLGPRGFSKFKLFRQNIEERNYRGAAEELRNSLYFRQLKKRVQGYIDILNTMS